MGVEDLLFPSLPMDCVHDQTGRHHFATGLVRRDLVVIGMDVLCLPQSEDWLKKFQPTSLWVVLYVFWNWFQTFKLDMPPNISKQPTPFQLRGHTRGPPAESKMHRLSEWILPWWKHQLLSPMHGQWKESWKGKFTGKNASRANSKQIKQMKKSQNQIWFSWPISTSYRRPCKCQQPRFHFLCLTNWCSRTPLFFDWSPLHGASCLQGGISKYQSATPLFW